MAGINAGIGGTTSFKTNSYSAPQDSLGFALEIQVKFTPNRKVSQIVGYRITTNFGNDFATLSNGTSQSYKADSLAVVTNTVFVGISFNW